MKITKANGKAEYALIENLKKRAGEADQKIVDIVSTIIRNVKENGDDAVREYTVRFDGSVPKKTVITKEELQSYLDMVDDDFKSAIIKAKDNIYDFHLRQAQQSWMTTKENGVIMGQRVRGLHRVGIYVPGGTAAYPSSVLMNAVPAKIAGVKEIIMVTPPGKDGNPNPNIMAAAAVAGVDKVFMVGGKVQDARAQVRLWSAERRLLPLLLTAQSVSQRWIRLSDPAIFLSQPQRNCFTE